MYKIFTKAENKLIPKNVIIVKNKHGWLFLADFKGEWLTNGVNNEMISQITKSKKDEDIIALMIPNIKNQLKLHEYNAEEALKKQGVEVDKISGSSPVYNENKA